MFSSKKGIEMTMTLMVTVAVCLFALVIYFFMAGDFSEKYKSGTECEAYGHVRAEVCDERYSIPNTLFTKNEDGLTCCMERPGKKDDFIDWKKTQIPISQGGTAGTDDTQISSSEATVSSNNYLKAVDELPNYPETGHTENYANNDIVEGNPYLKINGEDILPQQIAPVSTGKITLEAKNTNLDASLCSLELQRENPDGTYLPAISSQQYTLNTCNKFDWMAFSTTIQEGTYKLVFTIEHPKGQAAFPPFYAFVRAEGTQAESSDELKERYIKIEKKEGTFNRKGKSLAFVYADLQAGEPFEIGKWYVQTELGRSCADPSLQIKYRQLEGPLSTVDITADQVCIRYDVAKTDEYKSAQTEPMTITNIDKLFLFDNVAHATYFSHCDENCNSYNNDNSPYGLDDDDKCALDAARKTNCRYQISCFVAKDDTHAGKKYCADCSQVSECEHLSTRSACDQNQCLDVDCEWDGNGLAAGFCASSS